MNRLLAAALTGLLLTAASLTPAAATEDDPTPWKYPQIERPDRGSNTGDPLPVRYPRIEQPDAVGGDEDPKPPHWPAPKAG
ncbi:hypothetical protein ACFTSF_37760 [Kribbella sp. NPDC056951]|uniref:hypothetical protein n=1 Tax=Kribbella sp. NPDC056951 TaxID=3345978 RepID=UPI003632A51F